MSDVRLLAGNYDVFDYSVVREAAGGDPSVPGGQQTKLMMKGILQKADTLNQNGRIYTRDVLEREVRNYQKFIIENRALGECVLPGTEIYTSVGWKKIEEIDDLEIIATLNVDKNELEFKRINKKIDISYVGKMFRFKNARTFDMCLTPNHNILLWDRNGNPKKITARELYEGYKLNDSTLSHSGLRRAKANWTGEDYETITIAGKELDADVWAAFLGIYVAEGHSSGVYAEHRKEQHRVVITQNVGETADKIRMLMCQLPWEHSEHVSCEGRRLDFVICDKTLHEQLIELGGSREKHLPKYVKQWSPRLLGVLLEWMLLGDGRHRIDHHGELIPEYCTSSPNLAQDVYDVMLKLGTGATINIYDPIDKPSPDFNETGRMILAENQVPMHVISMSSSCGMALDFRFMDVDVVDYDGRVYCVNVDNGTWLMKYNGKVCWTGNCDHPESSVINLKNVSHIVREAYMKGNDVNGTIEILNTPSGLILKSLVESGIKLGISSRGVGSTRKQGDYHIVQDDFQLICWDVVSEPSTPSAFLIPEGKKIGSNELRRIFTKTDRINRIVNEILNINHQF